MNQQNYMPLLEWLAWRRQGICSTDASIIMRAVPRQWGTISTLWLDKTGRPVPPRERTYRMRRGTKLEPVARAEYERMTGVPMRQLHVENAANPVFRASLDGLNEDVGRVLEIKCPGKEDHAVALSGRIPDKYLWQCVHQLMVTELPELHYFSFDGKRGVIVPFRRDSQLEEQLLAEEMKFWALVEANEPPPAEAQPKAPPVSPTASFQERLANVLEFRRNRR